MQKPRRIAFNRLIERLGEHTVELGQVGIDDHALATYHPDTALGAGHHGVRWAAGNCSGYNVFVRILCN